MTTLRRALFVTAVAVGLGLLAPRFPAAQTPAAQEPGAADISFNRDIRPILSNRCFKCHGPDLKKGGLDLQSRDGAVKKLRSGERAVVPGNSADSVLLYRVSSHDKTERMPPTGDALSAAQVAKLKAWIDQGAKYEEHWAYVKPVRHPLPAVKNKDWPRNGIDHFVLARLEREGLQPAPEADRARLIRRVSLDLTGLPPTVQEVDDFLNDNSPNAYEKVVDRLLASPHYGEHQARFWLDHARYADTNGYEADQRRTIWPYRDWVINAFNRDLPFDQFTIEQLAGDLLPNPTRDQLVATGFHRNTMVNTEGGTDDEEFRVAAVVDRVNTTMEVWMGTTMNCAQCHNHKYDPFSQKEYFQLYAFLNNTADRGKANAPEIPIATTAEDAQRKQIAAQLAPLQQQLDRDTPELRSAQAKWEQSLRGQDAAWVVLQPGSLKSANGSTLTKLKDGSVLTHQQSPPTDTYTITVDLPGSRVTTWGDQPSLQGAITAIKLEVLTDKNLPGKGPGRAGGNFVLSAIKVTVTDRKTPTRAVPVPLQNASADFSQAQFDVALALVGKPKTGWAVAPQFGTAHAAVFETKQDVDAPGQTLTVTLDQQYGGQHTIGRFRLWATTSPRPVRVGTLPDEVAAALRVPADKRTAAQANALAKHYRSVAPELAKVRTQIAELKKQEATIKPATTMVMKELPAPRETKVHIRGNHRDLGEKVTPAVPAKWHKLPEGPSNRLTLAKWLVSPENPLVGRVLMNRVWARYFGRGFVETSEDFGAQGEPPTHPELLDWLATELVAQKWSVKAMHRTVVLSATYRQSARGTPDLHKRDPFNRLYARGPRYRMDAEMVRDNALAVSGLLTRKLGGPSVFPFQPDGIWANPYSGDKWVMSTNGDQYRRGLYTFWRRTAPYASFMAFDAPSREVACERRPRTNTPLQALAVLNDKAFVEPAAALARRMLSEVKGDDRARATHGFRLCVARAPSAAEAELLLELYRDNLAKYQKDAAAAKAMAGLLPPPSAKVDPAELAAWTVVANVLLNLDETITK
jgi:mono/diheme cytochrome c family protein